MGRKYQITGIGNAIVDIICKVDDKFLTDHNLVKGSMFLIDESGVKHLSSLKPEEVKNGGSAANSISALARLGTKTAFIGKVGSGEFGKKFSDNLKTIGCDFYCKNKTAKDTTAKSFILVTPDGERTMCTYLGQASKIEDEIDEQAIANSSFLYLEGYLWDEPETIASMREAVDIAMEKNVKIGFSLSDAFCVERHKLDFLELTQHLNILFANEVEIKALMGENYADNDYAQLKSTLDHHNPNLIIVITCSKNGSLIINGKKEILKVPTKIIDNVIDSTGAGDSFAAGFLYGLTQGFNFEKSAKVGNIMAGKIIQKLGARYNDSEIKEIKSLIKAL